MRDRIRSIHPEILTDPLFCALNDTTKLLYMGSWILASDQGIFLDEPSELEARIFHTYPPRPVSESIDVLVATGRLVRAIAPPPDGRRILMISNFDRWQHPQHPSLPNICWRWEAMVLPVPSPGQRDYVQQKFNVTSWEKSVSVTCEKCGRGKGRLRFAQPMALQQEMPYEDLGEDISPVGEEEPWSGSVVAGGGVEIIPFGENPSDVMILCRRCRTDAVWSGPSGTPTTDLNDGFKNSQAGKKPKWWDGFYTDGRQPPVSKSSLPRDRRSKRSDAGGPAQSNEADIVQLRSDDSGRPRSVNDSIQEVFDTWRLSDSAGRLRTEVLDGPRLRRIGEALKQHGRDDVLDAVRGWVNVEFNNPYTGGAGQNDISVLLKDATNIKRFRDAFRLGAPKTGAAVNVGSFEEASSSRESL